MERTWSYEFQYLGWAVSDSLRRTMILSMELAVVLFRLENACEVRHAMGCQL